MRRRILFSSMAAAELLQGRTSRAQQKTMPLIGWLSIGAPGPTAPFVAEFREGVAESGYVEGQNLAIEYRWAGDRYDRLPELAADLVGRKVDVIVSGGGSAVGQAAKKATSTIPIVFVGGDDPVAAGLVSSLARPDGNLTGSSIISVELDPKRLELLRELIPRANLFGVLMNPQSPANARRMPGLLEVARRKAVQMQMQMGGSENEIAAAFASFVAPKIGGSRAAVFRQAGIYAGRILKGAKPAELPVLQPTLFETVINVKTARALGLTRPPALLARADEVIE